MIIYAVTYIAFFPPIYSSLDESANFGMAYVLRHGTVFPALAGYDLAMSPIGPHGPIYRFPIGFPALLSILSFLGWHTFFLVNPLFHLVATWLFARILQTLKMPVGLALLYLFYPGFVLYERTLFSDPFAASLTTAAIYFLICGKPRPSIAGLCLGMALLARSTSLLVAGVFFAGLLLSDWRSRSQTPFWRGQAIPFGLGLLPFLCINSVYNYATTGHFSHGTYDAGMLSASNLVKLGPLYGSSLLLIFPGMLLAPLVYRGRFWGECLAATFAVTLVAASYYETTYGGNRLETLISVVRQVLPVLPLYLLAYCGVLATLLVRLKLREIMLTTTLGLLLLVVSIGISVGHQKHLRTLVALKSEMAQTLPPQTIIYGNKDVFKLFQPIWQHTICRDLTNISRQDAMADLRSHPVFAVLYIRSRGVANEDGINAQAMMNMRREFVLKPGPTSQSGLLQYYRITGVRG